MKCHACGFIGFDHLSQCSKCGSDLTSVRDKFGFVKAKSAAPLFLGALLKDRPESNVTSTTESQNIEPAVSAILQIESGEAIRFTGEDLQADTVQASSNKGSPVAHPFSHTEESVNTELMIDLSDEDLDQVMSSKKAEEELDLNLDFLLEDDSLALTDGNAAGGVTGNGGGKPTGAGDEVEMSEFDAAGLELTDEDLDQLAAEADLAVDLGPGLSDFTEKENTAALDLSDDDLHTLIRDLEVSMEKKAEQPDA